MPSALQFRNIAKRFGSKAVLKDISFSVENGEAFGLVGMNGAGKTTLIKSLLDFIAIDAGTIEIFGRSSRQTQAREPLAFLPERFIPPYYLTGQDFLRYMFKLRSLAWEPQAIHSMLALLDLDPAVLSRPVRTYSKGMMQKLGLSACLLAKKALYVLDEPMSGLDPKARALLKTQLVQLRTDGATLFFSSHALADVEEICDRMAILHEGEVRFIGTPLECRRKFDAATLEQAYMECIR